MSFNISLVSLTLITLITSLYNSAEYSGPIPQNFFDYIYDDYWSKDQNSCIVSDSTISHPGSQFAGVPSIRKCNGDYVINNSTLILPRNTMPICAYEPSWYDANTKFYLDLYSNGFKSGNSTYDYYKSECMDEMTTNTKTQVLEMYDFDIHHTICVRYSEFLTTTYGLDPEIVDIVEKVEENIKPEVQWTNTEIQARVIVSTICVAINKDGCVALWDHLLSERDNSVLNLLGHTIDETTPSTWLYADGIDIELLHNLVEIMGYNLEVNEINGIFYYYVSKNLPSNHIIKYKPGLVGGIHN